MTNNLKERFLFFLSFNWVERKKERKNETKNKIKIKRKYKILESDTDVDDDGLSPFSVRNSLTSNVDLFHFEPLSPPPRLPPPSLPFPLKLASSWSFSLSLSLLFLDICYVFEIPIILLQSMRMTLLPGRWMAAWPTATSITPECWRWWQYFVLCATVRTGICGSC